MKISKKLRNLALGGLLGLASLTPLKATADAKKMSILNTPLSMTYDKNYHDNQLTLDLKDEYNNSIGINDVIKEVPETIALWYLADAIRLIAHEEGHYDKANELGSDASVDIYPTINGILSKIDGTTTYYNDLNKEDAAEFNIAGLIRMGGLAENLKSDILYGNNSKGDLRFKSILALSAELNLPRYLATYYMDSGAKDPFNDINNFSRNSGIKPEQIAISSGIHLLLNSPYLYKLTKNAFGCNSKDKRPKKVDISFRYNGDSYSINIHADMDSLIEKIEKPDLSRFGSKL